MVTAFREKSPCARTRALATLKLGELTKEKDKKRAVSLYNEALAKYASLPFNPETNISVAQEARSNLFEIEHLSLGMIAPSIVGEDASGHIMRLSDYRGKVVLLDFFGNW